MSSKEKIPSNKFEVRKMFLPVIESLSEIKKEALKNIELNKKIASKTQNNIIKNL